MSSSASVSGEKVAGLEAQNYDDPDDLTRNGNLNETQEDSESELEIKPFNSTIGPFWPGYESISELVVLGDSYSSISFLPLSPRPSPTPKDPLGVPFPGQTWTEGEGRNPNWVGWLVKWRYGLGIQGEESSSSSGGDDDDDGVTSDSDSMPSANEETRNPLLVYNYALGGETVGGVALQVKRVMKTFGRPEGLGEVREGDVDASKRLFATWVGINDCGQLANTSSSSDPYTKAITDLTTLQHTLYTTCAARNFLLIDVPPIHRAPCFPSITSSYKSHYAKIYTRWNVLLRTHLYSFQDSHPDASVMMFSAWDLFGEILDRLAEFGFGGGGAGEREVRRADMLHPTSRLHEVVAGRVKVFLEGFIGRGGAV